MSGRRRCRAENEKRRRVGQRSRRRRTAGKRYARVEGSRRRESLTENRHGPLYYYFFFLFVFFKRRAQHRAGPWLPRRRTKITERRARRAAFWDALGRFWVATAVAHTRTHAPQPVSRRNQSLSAVYTRSRTDAIACARIQTNSRTRKRANHAHARPRAHPRAAPARSQCDR